MNDPALIMPEFMVNHFLSDDDINPYTGYSISFERSLSPTSLGLYEEFERASQNFETLKSEGKPLGDAIRHHYLSEQAFNDRQEDSFKNEARSQFSRLVKDGVVDTAEWAAANPFAAAYATGEMALSTAGAVMTGGRNAYEVAFHGKQLKAAAFETALAFAATKGAIKAVKGVSRLVSRGMSVKKLSLLRGKGATDAYRGLKSKQTLQSTQTKIYLTYTKPHPQGGSPYVGRTSGMVTDIHDMNQIQKILDKRNVNHHMNSKGFGRAKLDAVSTNPHTIRGAEQIKIDALGGAQSKGGVSSNAINSVRDNNPNIRQYVDAAAKELYGNH